MMKRLSAVLISAVLLSACDGGGRPPIAPSVPTLTPTPSPAPAPTTPVVTYTLSGTISKSRQQGGCPLRASEFTVMAAAVPLVTLRLYTDADGLYSFEWSQNGATPLLVGKAGYDVVGQVPNEYRGDCCNRQR